ncbi:MAG: hypothetical protein H0X66_09100 [Verrucomicrobia bacterium]|nr:hypothetical protein [Verrucomicrobiota bacterium]
MKLIKSILFIFVLGGVLSITGCEKGPMEKAGEKVDKAVEKTGEALEDAGDAVKDAVNE